MPIGLAERQIVDRGDNTQEPYVKRVTLPSGKSIEVMYFAEQVGSISEVPSGDAPTGDQPLHVCV